MYAFSVWVICPQFTGRCHLRGLHSKLPLVSEIRAAALSAARDAPRPARRCSTNQDIYGRKRVVYNAKRLLRGILVVAVVIVTSVADSRASDFDYGLLTRNWRYRYAAGVYHEQWQDDRTGPLGEPLQQTSYYVHVAQYVTSKAHVEALGVLTRTYWGAAGDVSKYQRDTKVRISYQYWRPLVIHVGTNIPTGYSPIEQGDLVLASGIANRLKGYRVSKFGEGLDFDLGVAWAQQSTAWSFGQGLDYLHKGTYDMVVDQPKYRPGYQIVASLAADRRWGPTNRESLAYKRFRAILLVTLYGDDTQDGRTVLKFGPRYRLSLQYNIVGRREWWIRARYMHSSESDFIEAAALPTSSAEGVGDEAYVDGAFCQNFGHRWRLTVSSEVRALAQEDRGAASGHRYTISGGGSVHAGPWWNLIGWYGAGRQTGGVVGSDAKADVDIHGYGIELSLEVRGDRN